jgi:AcrR family transcriptional regulator
MAVDTKEKILVCAQRLFAAKGYIATSMREISETVGIGKATIYHHFPDKEAILTGLLEKGFERMDTAMAAIRRKSRPEECIGVVVSASFRAAGRPWRRNTGDNCASTSSFSPTRSAEARSRAGSATSIPRKRRAYSSMIQGSFAMNFPGGGRADTAAGSILDIFFRGIQL